jgi:hypothetical protein
MISDGGADSDRHDNIAPGLTRDRSELRRILGLVVFVIVAVALLFGGSDMIHIVKARRWPAMPSASAAPRVKNITAKIG